MGEYYVMHRKGTFSPSVYSSNQCKGYGHTTYEYELVMAFVGTESSLDSNGFLIDHADIDNMIHNLLLNGSCEEMHLMIRNGLATLMVDNNVPMVAYKSIIRPVNPEGAAYMKYVWWAEGHQFAINCIS